jgi:sugar (pentulose or hexulose) kinase
MTTSTTGAGTGAEISLAAVDLGTSSGRVIHGRVGPGVLQMTEVRRFRNGAVTLPDGLYWDVLGLYQDIIAGLRDVARLEGNLQGIGIDSWAVDYGLVDAGGSLLANPRHYRDPRTVPVIDSVHAAVPAEKLYGVNGLQYLPFKHPVPIRRARPPARPGGAGADDSRPFAYISCGTWGLVGVELDAPVLSEDSRAANFTNERGVDGTVRYLRNVMGLWLLSETLRKWELRGQSHPLTDLITRAAALPPAGRPSTPTHRNFCRRATCRRGSQRRAGNRGSAHR